MRRAARARPSQADPEVTRHNGLTETRQGHQHEIWSLSSPTESQQSSAARQSGSHSAQQARGKAKWCRHCSTTNPQHCAASADKSGAIPDVNMSSRATVPEPHRKVALPVRSGGRCLDTSAGCLQDFRSQCLSCLN